MGIRKKFNGRTAFVTGGSSGIGRALCLALAKNGAAVTVADKNFSGADLVASEIIRGGGTAAAMKTDVTDPGSFRKALKASLKKFGRIDFLFNNAGVGFSCDFRDCTARDMDMVFNVNFRGAVNGIMEIYPLMIARGGGHIINIASMAGIIPFSINVPYTASKFALAGLTLSLMAEARDLGVNMTLVCPGVIKTAFYDSITVKKVDRKKYVSGLPSRMMGPERAAEIILRGVAGNKKMIVFPFHARFLFMINKIFPSLIYLLNKAMIKKFRKMSSN
ncbi:MAG: SDR family oxidoreductase [Spirochaetes bacterium]|jgi:NAD(P)-dependent dehydrogenase (short-subunit alcohol dehydrogenase family)|nr:SDR family oxidoreductase [Spirochaetota bacterium]